MADSSDLPALAQATAGALGSAVSNTIVYPLDLCSARIQTQSSKPGKKSYTSLVGALQDIVEKQGVKGLYQGWVSDTISNTLSNFLFFYLRGFLIERLLARKAAGAGSGGKGKAPTLTGAEDLIVGMIAGVGSRFVTTPLSNVTVRHQTSATSSKKEEELDEKRKQAAAAAGGNSSDSDSDDERTYSESPSVIGTLKEIMEQDGVSGLWAGFPTAMLLSVTPALTFYLSHITGRVFTPPSRRDNPSTLSIYLTNMTANSLSTLILFPLILSKTRLQWRSPSGRKVYKSLMDVLRKTVRKQGVTGLYQGLNSQLAKGVGGFGTTMVVKARVEKLWYTVFLILRNRAKTTAPEKA